MEVSHRIVLVASQSTYENWGDTGNSSRWTLCTNIPRRMSYLQTIQCHHTVPMLPHQPEPK